MYCVHRLCKCAYLLLVILTATIALLDSYCAA